MSVTPRWIVKSAMRSAASIARLLAGIATKTTASAFRTKDPVPRSNLQVDKDANEISFQRNHEEQIGSPINP